MSDSLRSIAEQLMETFIRAQSRRNPAHNPSAYNRKPGEVMVLHFIGANSGDGGGLMISEISGKLGVTSPTVTQHINNLEAQGLVERHADPGDRRIVRIRLTDKGSAYIQRIREARLDMFVGLAEHLGKEESLQLIKLMKKASDYLLGQQQLRMGNLMADDPEGSGSDGRK